MLAPSGAEDEPFTTVDPSLYQLGSISEDSHIRAPSASPDDLTVHYDSIDFGGHPKSPKRSSTFPYVPRGPSVELALKIASNGYQRNQERRSEPPASEKLVHPEPNSPETKQIRHSATIDTYNSASFEDTAVWDQKAILSLDGGGIRGYSALLILQELMKAIGRIERKYASGPSKADGPAESSYHPLEPLSPAPCMATNTISKAYDGDSSARTESSPWLPCHYFDYVAGTSTGGLIGIMLGRLRMNVDDCISEYEILGAEVFGHSRIFHLRSPLFWPRDKYNFKSLERVVEDVVRRRVPKVAEFPGGTNFAFDENRCRTVVVSFQQQSEAGAEKPYLFRTYKNLHKSKDSEERKLDRNPDLAHDIPIWQVARATSAAPTYFKPPIIDGLEYVDGGFGANNPCAEIYEEVRRMNNNSKRCASIILSIGTGKNNEARRFKGTGFQRYLNYLNFARKWASDSEQTHLAMLKAKSEVHFQYFRLNVEEGLDLMKLDEWRARGPVRTKIGERFGSFRSSSTKDRRIGNKAARASATKDMQAIFLKEKPDHLQYGNCPTHTNGNGSFDHAGQHVLEVPSEQFTDPTYTVDAVDNRSTAYMEHLGKEARTNTFDQPNGHSSTTSTSARKLDPDADNTDIPKWFRHKNRTLESIRKYTEDYLLDRNTIDMIERSAKILVDGRRSRAKSDPQRWEKACFGTWYQCSIPECPRGEKEYEQRGQLRKHLLDKHRTEYKTGDEGEGKLDDALNSCKIVVH